jgi:hypothetical protein
MLVDYPESELRTRDFAREGLSHGVDQFCRIPGNATTIDRFDDMTTQGLYNTRCARIDGLQPASRTDPGRNDNSAGRLKLLLVTQCDIVSRRNLRLRTDKQAIATLIRRLVTIRANRIDLLSQFFGF